MEKLIFVSLLYLNPGERSLNMSSTRRDNQLEVYIRNANLLGTSIGGRLLTVLTNDIETVSIRVRKYYGDEASFELRACKFSLKVPKGIRFYAAHFKVEAYALAANLFPDRYILFLDLDMVALTDVRTRIDQVNPERLPMVYSIIDQVAPVYGTRAIARDLDILVGFAGPAKWFGGEFIGGSPQFFLTLYRNILDIFPRYVAALETLHHHGDEALTTAALLLFPDHLHVIDAGLAGVVRRHWSGVPLHPQATLSLAKVDVALLHLPQDKNFLAKQDAVIARQGSFSHEAFLVKLGKYLTSRRIRGFIVRLLKLSRSKVADVVKNLFPSSPRP